MSNKAGLVNKMREPETVLVAVTPSACPSKAALAMATIDVTFGVSLAKNGILTAARTQRQMLRTSSGSCQSYQSSSIDGRPEI